MAAGEHDPYEELDRGRPRADVWPPYAAAIMLAVALVILWSMACAAVLTSSRRDACQDVVRCVDHGVPRGTCTGIFPGCR